MSFAAGAFARLSSIGNRFGLGRVLAVLANGSRLIVGNCDLCGFYRDVAHRDGYTNCLNTSAN